MDPRPPARALAATLTLVLAGGAARAADGFESVRCGADVRAALMGRKTSDEPVAAIEARHKDLGLKGLGGYEVSDALFLSSWRICNAEVMLLEEKGVVKDVLSVPSHSKAAPETIGTCTAAGKKLPGVVVAILTGAPGAESTSVPAAAAWRVDEKEKRFVNLETQGVLCDKGDIVTADGGK